MNYLRTAFKIPPAQGGTSLHLLIEVGYEGISFVYYNRQPLTIEGLYIYHFAKDALADAHADELKHFLESEELPASRDCDICYNYTEFSMVPVGMFSQEIIQPVMDTLFGGNLNVAEYNVLLKPMEAQGLYRVNADMEHTLMSRYPAAKTHHSIALQIPELLDKKDLLYTVIYQHTMKIFLVKEGLLQFVQFFEYNSPADAAYHNLNVCQQHGCDPGEIPLVISGFVDKKSNLYDELHKYFLQISVDEIAESVTLSEAVAQYPTHFFSHLILLVKCVS